MEMEMNRKKMKRKGKTKETAVIAPCGIVEADLVLIISLFYLFFCGTSAGLSLALPNLYTYLCRYLRRLYYIILLDTFQCCDG